MVSFTNRTVRTVVCLVYQLGFPAVLVTSTCLNRLQPFSSYATRGSNFRKSVNLAAKADKAVDDRCRASCVDWYGNARPLFLRGRMFALLGYELVEGSVMQGRIREVGRINYAP